jgi:two-component system, cell cycle sensor histidine kinase and response regulator CckA
LLAFTSQQTLSPKLLDLNAVIQAVGTRVESLLPEDIELRLELDLALAKVRADSSQLVGVLLSLANNAMEAMPEGGRLTIRSENVEVEEQDALRLPGVPPGRYVLLAVADTGVGMSDEVQAHLFEPFFSTKDRARGLGLPAIYGIIQQSGGHILVESKPGAGATFRIYLPEAIDS